MTSDETCPVGENFSPRIGWIVLGGLISLISTFVLVRSQGACVDVILGIFAKNLSQMQALVRQLEWVSWCPFCVALGTVFIAMGLRQAAQRGRLSLPSLSLIATYGILATCGAVLVFRGLNASYEACRTVARSNQPITTEEFHDRLTQTQASAMVSQGWKWLFAAQFSLVLGSVWPLIRQVKSSPTFWNWPFTKGGDEIWSERVDFHWILLNGVVVCQGRQRRW